jgi:shikimate kinase
VAGPEIENRPDSGEEGVTEPASGGAAEAESGADSGLYCDLKLDRPVALVGLMGAGKTTVGRRLAAALHLPFVDADEEIERAAGLTVQEIFKHHGEADFRRGERQVIARLLTQPPHILATGGGAFMDEGTRALMKQKAISVWLKAPLEVLLRRVERREGRPLLKQGDPHVVMQRLMQERYPIYAEADVTVDSTNGPHAATVTAVLAALKKAQAERPAT